MLGTASARAAKVASGFGNSVSLEPPLEGNDAGGTGPIGGPCTGPGTPWRGPTGPRGPRGGPCIGPGLKIHSKLGWLSACIC